MTNKCLEVPIVEEPQIFVKSRGSDTDPKTGELRPLVDIDLTEIIGRMYLNAYEEVSQRFLSKIVDAIVDHQDDIKTILTESSSE
jgi:hypothetical protein